MTETPAKRQDEKKRSTALVDGSKGYENRLVRFLNLMGVQDSKKFKNARIFFHSFWVDEKTIERINEIAMAALSDFGDGVEFSFQSRTRFASMMEDHQDNIEDFMRRATDEDVPESVSLEWSCFIITPDGEGRSASIQIKLVTEQRLSSQEVGMHVVNQALLQLETSGTEKDWVSKTFREIEPLLKNSTLNGFYSVMNVFRSNFFNMIVSQALGFIGFFTGLNLAERFLKAEDRTSRSDVIDQIVSEPGIPRKIDLLVQELLDPTLDPWWEPILVISTGALAFGVIWTLAGFILPKLAPPSFIAVGTSADKAKRKFDTYKLIVGGVIFGSVMLPLAVSGLGKYLFGL